MNEIDYHRPKSSLEEWSDILSWLLLLMILFITARHFADLPERVPTHINALGEADRWGARRSVWLLPGLAILLHGLMSLAQRFPKMINYPVRITPENAQRQFDLARTFIRVIRAATLALLLGIQWSILQIALGGANRLSNPLMVLFVLPILLIVPIAVYMVLAIRRR